MICFFCRNLGRVDRPWLNWPYCVKSKNSVRLCENNDETEWKLSFYSFMQNMIFFLVLNFAKPLTTNVFTTPLRSFVVFCGNSTAPRKLQTTITMMAWVVWPVCSGRFHWNLLSRVELWPVFVCLISKYKWSISKCVHFEEGGSNKIPVWSDSRNDKHEKGRMNQTSWLQSRGR